MGKIKNIQIMLEENNLNNTTLTDITTIMEKYQCTPEKAITIMVENKKTQKI